jgi:signal transduction histidine kinase
MIDRLGMAVHSLKNPASGIAVAAEYLIEDGSSDFTEKQLLLLRGILNSASSLLRAIDEIRDMPNPANGESLSRNR